MKKYILVLCIFFGALSSGYSQEFGYGFKGGVNYAMGGQITGINSGEGYFDGTVEGTPDIGFHVGIFGQVNFGRFFIRPEVVYASLKSEYNFPIKPSTYSVEKVNIPLLFGYNVFGPFDVYAGPVYSNIITSSLMGDEDPGPIVAQNSPINLQAGAKVEFGRFGLDLRYEHSMSTAEVQQLDIVHDEYGINRATFDDARLNQIILSVIFKIGGPGLNEGRSRPCY